MSSTWGKNIVISIFGESHGAEIGCVLDGLPSGIPLDLEAIKADLAKRSASSYELATPRKEKDEFEIVSGFFNGYTTGTPLCAVIKNTNTKSKDYTPELLRPSHADYTAYKRYKGYQDYRGGGHFSGRLTAPFVLAGSICKQAISKICPQIEFRSRIVSIGSVKDEYTLELKEYSDFKPTGTLSLYNTDLEEEILDEIRNNRKNRDSIGGIIEGWILNLPAGIGDPFFGSIESELSSLLFSIPAVKGVEFGTGFELAYMKGSEANDTFYIDEGEILTTTNHNGGINGGISNGMPVVFKCAIKPTPSISQTQNTVNYEKKENDTITIHGRHDPCIVLRTPIIIEAAAAVCILDLLMGLKEY